MTNTELADVLKEARSLIAMAERPPRGGVSWEQRAERLIPAIDRAVGYLVDGGPVRGTRPVTDPRD